jgi:hypothetical protein
MPDFTYTGDEGRYYTTLGITPEPGETVTLDVDPGDGRWEAVADVKPFAVPQVTQALTSDDADKVN